MVALSCFLGSEETSISAFQAAYEGSIPSTRSIFNKANRINFFTQIEEFFEGLLHTLLHARPRNSDTIADGHHVGFARLIDVIDNSLNGTNLPAREVVEGSRKGALLVADLPLTRTHFLRGLLRRHYIKRSVCRERV